MNTGNKNTQHKPAAQALSDPTGSLQDVKVGDTFWHFCGSCAPRMCEIIKPVSGVTAYKIRFNDGFEDVTSHSRLFDTAEELAIAVQGHAYFLAEWEREFTWRRQFSI